MIVVEGIVEQHAPMMRNQRLKTAGYSQFKTKRRHMAKIGDWRNHPSLEIPLDGVGGVSLLIRGEVHRKGNFASRV